MDFQTQELLINRLNGYVMAMSSVDGKWGDSIASAYVSNLDESNILESLNAHLQQGAGNQYIYESVSEICKTCTRELVVALDSFFFKQPFSMLSDLMNGQIKITRERMVTEIEDLIGLITNDFKCERIYRVRMRWGSDYAGYMHIFPLVQRFLILKTISRLS